LHQLLTNFTLQGWRGDHCGGKGSAAGLKKKKTKKRGKPAADQENPRRNAKVPGKSLNGTGD